MTDQERYDEMYAKLMRDEISVEDWNDFVDEIFLDLLQENTETLEKLKEV